MSTNLYIEKIKKDREYYKNITTFSSSFIIIIFPLYT